jgi:simple sugar transport system ATP-binding protein
MGVGESQLVEIVKVLWRGADVLILDEPTAVLAPSEVEGLVRILLGLVKEGKTVVLVTHKLDEVLALADRVTVLRRGEVVATLEARSTTAVELARAMVGRDVVLAADRNARPPPPAAARPARLELGELTVVRANGTLALDGVTLAVGGGEIVGVAGVEGNGQSELGLAVAGVLAPARGRVRLDGVDVTHESVRARRRRGLSHVPEDRQERGLVLDFSVEENLLLGREEIYARPGRLDFARLRSDAVRILERLDVRPADPRARAAALSGGNQQKVVVGRELERAPSVLVCAQPTRGVDVGAAARIHDELLAVRQAGGAVLLVSADLDELLALSDRVAVLYRGRLCGVVDNPPDKAARAEVRARVGALMLGAERAGQSAEVSA